MTKVGFIGLGNVGAKLAGTLQRNEVDLWVYDIEPAQAAPFLAQGAAWADSPPTWPGKWMWSLPVCRPPKPAQP